MVLVHCEVCNKSMEGGWNLSQHLIGKDHLKKLARWQGGFPYRPAAPVVEVVQMPDLDDDDEPTTTKQSPPVTQQAPRHQQGRWRPGTCIIPPDTLPQLALRAPVATPQLALRAPTAVAP